MDEFTHGKIVGVDIAEQMKEAYIDYAMSVIVGRALPDVRDGLKPVHRRILYAAQDMGLTPNNPHKKSARLVGEVMGKYHPHGDAAIYDTAVRLAQDFSTRYTLIDGHGNFGSIDGDAAAAMRYTEMKLTPLAMEMLRDIDKETVDFDPNFDETLKEPTVLPSRFPNLLVNGSSGIAVGMATNIPPHNLGEVIDALFLLIEKPDATVQEIMMRVKGPDFPTGGIIFGKQGIRSAYKNGRGIIKVRAKAHIEQVRGSKHRIVVGEIPYQVNKASLLEKIADLVKAKKIDGITDLRDESDREGLRIVIELRRDVNPRIILNQLYKHTPMQTGFGIILLALDKGEPRVMNLKQMLVAYLDHQKEVIIRRTRFDLKKAEERAHILEGLLIALKNLDEIIKLIRHSQTVDEARQGLMNNFNLSEKQAQAILDMRLQRLTGLEQEKVKSEYQDLIKKIEYLRSVLASEAKVYQIIKEELGEIKKKFADKRRTEITAASGDFDIEDLIPKEDVVITLTHQGYIKRLPSETYRSQRRGGRGVSALSTKQDDFVEHLFITTTYHYMLFFSSKGKVYRIKVHEIPEASRQARGTAIVNLIPVNPGEKITAVIPIEEFTPGSYMLMVTRHGIVKKTDLTEYENVPRNGLIAISLYKGDELISVKLTNGEREVIMGTRTGQCIRFSEDDVRPMGRSAHGVKGINLRGDDEVIGMDIVKEKGELLTVTALGYGKRTLLDEYRPQSRSGIGIRLIKRTERTGEVVGLKVVQHGDDVMLITEGGTLIRMDVGDISVLGRNTQGVKMIRLLEGDRVVSLEQVVPNKRQKQAKSE